MLILALACAPDPVDTDDTDVAVDPRDDRSTWPDTLGGDRPAQVVYPSTWDGSALPVVVLLHGYSATAAVQDSYFGLSDRVDQGFALVLPDGTVDASGKQFWNATDYCCDFGNTAVDDVGYLTGLLDELEAGAKVDPDRVVLVGHSNGGFMAHRMACDRPDRLAGIVSLAGVTWKDETKCEGGAVDVLQIHGTEDDTITYAGDAGAPGAEETVAWWAAKNGCTGPLADVGTADYDSAVSGAETTTRAYGGCEVGLWTMTGSGHIPLFKAQWKDDVVAWALARSSVSR